MKSSARIVELASVDDLFSTEESRQDAAREKIMEIPLAELFPFEGHPFSVRDDDAMKETVESLKEYGVLAPAIARPREGGYELVSGHRRKRACELAGLETMPVIVRNLDRDAAIIIITLLYSLGTTTASCTTPFAKRCWTVPVKTPLTQWLPRARIIAQWSICWDACPA